MAWIRVFGRAHTPLNSSNLVYCTTTALLLYYYCNTTVLLLYYYCTTTVLLLYFCTTVVLLLYYYGTATPYQASDVVDCGGECRLEAKVFKMTGFSLGSYLGVTVAWLRAFL